MNKERQRKLEARKRREASRSRGTAIQVPQPEVFPVCKKVPEKKGQVSVSKRGPGRPFNTTSNSLDSTKKTVEGKGKRT